MPTEEKNYHKIKPVKLEKTVGTDYPQNDIGMADVWVKGKYPAGTKKKQYETMRGAGAATKGKKFLNGLDI